MTSPTQRNWMLAAMFAAGFFTGAALIAGLAWKYLPPPGMPSGQDIVARVRQEMRSQLKLTPAQDQALNPILDRHVAELNAIRQTTLEAIYRTVETKNAAVRAQLTPEQRPIFDRMEAKRLKMFQDHIDASPSPRP